jgi:hypothetical protein
MDPRKGGEKEMATSATKSREAKLEAKATRARLRRLAQGSARQRTARQVQLHEQLYKPMSEWDAEELARGRPRDKGGAFRGPAPGFLSRQVHEEAIKRFTDLVQSDMRAIIPTAIETVRYILEDDAVDKRGRPLVPMSTKLDAAKWVVEHLVGKPTLRVEADISVRLQSLLGTVMVAPEDIPDGHRLAIDIPSYEVDLDEDS